MAAALGAVLMSAPCRRPTSNEGLLHQWPGGKGDVRDEMVQMIARHMQEANTGSRSRCTRASRCSSRRNSGAR